MEFIKEHFDEQLEAQTKEPRTFAETHPDARRALSPPLSEPERRLVKLFFLS
jgi:hypothetical protein